MVSFAVSGGEFVVNPTFEAPRVAEASDEGRQAIKQFVVEAPLEVQLVAAEPNLANPVAFHIDSSGSIYVAETFRHSAGVQDIRGIMSWLDEELASRTADDRLAMIKRYLGDNLESMTQQTDQVRKLFDDNGDGVMDRSTVFATGFNEIMDGLGSGVLSVDGTVYYACTPNLWALKDTDGDGVADERRSLHYGYGVRAGFLGHDLHGLIQGPDGRIYFSIGDRGSHIETEGRVVGNPDTGCVFRCEPDGSNLEVFAFGLRNPQELAFDQYGNLWTGDNNSDSGDKARWVYLVEGGDSGWRIGYQFLEGRYSRGPWNAEKLWYPQFEGQAAFIVPPIANIGSGPSGIAYYPGTGLGKGFEGHFFMSDFRGGKGSGIWTFTVEPKGASFELKDPREFIWEVLVTDVGFGVHDGIYWSDWVQGWNKTGKGRIYRAYDPSLDAIDLSRKQFLLSQRFAPTPELLGHADQRVRMKCQFEYVRRGDKSALTQVAENPKATQLARIHAIWGLGQMARGTGTAEVLRPLVGLLQDSDPEVRAQAAKGLGEVNLKGAYFPLRLALNDPEPRVRFFAALSIGKYRDSGLIAALASFLENNPENDPYLRHAGSMALAYSAEAPDLVALGHHESDRVRMGALLAMRRLQRPEIALFLNDANPAIVTEAARAINDEPIYGATLELAGLSQRDGLDEAAWRRIINANLRLATRQSAEALSALAMRDDLSPSMRVEALGALAEWANPSGRDRVIGVWRPQAHRPGEWAQQALAGKVLDLMKQGDREIVLATLRAVSRLDLKAAGSGLLELVREAGTDESIRAEALKVLGELKDERLSEALKLVENSTSESVRRQASRLQTQGQPNNAVANLLKTLESGSMAEKQTAIEVLGTVAGKDADAAILKLLRGIVDGSGPAELQLEILEAAEKRSDASVKDLLQQYRSGIDGSEDPLAPYRLTLAGGNAVNGRAIFAERQDVACIRCHQANGEGGEVGPVLTDVGTRLTPEKLLESIIYPNKEIAKGFETVIVYMKNGTAFAGLVKSETDTELVVDSPEDGLMKLKKANIESRNAGFSGMPEGMGQILTKKDLRDIMAYLTSLKN